MWKGALALTAALAFAVVAFAAEEGSLDQARKLVAEAKPFVEKANDVDLDMAERKEPRREAFKRLKEARALYDRYLDANPSKEEQLDKEYVETMVLLHGIKKDSALGELEKGDAPPELPPAGGEPEPPAPAPGAPTPAPDTAERAKAQLASIAAYEKAHPADLPQIQQLYSGFLADFPDTSLPEYAQAAERLGKVTDRMRTVFQATAKRDLDDLSGADTKSETAFVFRLSTELKSKDPEARRRAAKLLTATRSRPATYFLARGITDKDEEFAKLCRDGLVIIGGTAAGESLVKLFRDTPKEKQHAAMDVFRELVKKGPFEAVNQARSVGRFTLSNEGPVALAAFEILASLGKLGGPGLVVALDSRSMEKRDYAMKKMVEARYWKAAGILASRYLVEGKGQVAALRNSAMEAIGQMGVYAVPYLIEPLYGATGKYTGIAVSKIVGFEVESGERQPVRDWWARNKPADAD